MDTIVEKTVYTPDDLLHMQDGSIYELVDGQLLERAMSLEACALAARIIKLLANFVDEHQLGLVIDSSAGYQCFPDAPLNVRKPDLSFIRRERLREEIMHGHCPIAPDLAVEVVSPGDLYYEVEHKINEYLAAGVPMVWVVSPVRKEVQVHRADGSIIHLRDNMELTGDDVIPGFRCRVGQIFDRISA